MSFTTGSSTSSTPSSSSSSLGSTNVPQGTLGDVPPVTFPGIASGIDYNAIIEKYTAATQAAEVPYQDQLNKLNAANAEILKIQNLLNIVQDSLTALSNPATFEAFTATPSNTAVASATQVSGQVAVPGTYNIVSQTAATATQITNNTAANATLNPNVALVDAGTSVTPTNGTDSDGEPAEQGTLTINGVQIQYNVNSDTLQNIVTRINGSGAGVNATINADGTVTLTATTNAGIALGSGSDTGNLLQVLGLTNAQFVGSGNGETVTSAAPIVGINEDATLDATGNAGFATAVSSGFFTINGVQISVNAGTDSVNDIIQEINQSTAGVTASFNTATDQIVLTNGTSGPGNIILGASSDTSNFLVAAGLTGTYGTFTGDPNIPGTTTIGTQASVTYQNADGADVTAYSSSGTFTNVIPGIDLKVLSSTTSTNPYTVTVQNDPSAAEKAIDAFVTAYNNAMNEINSATAAPTVTSGISNTTGEETNSSSGGGVLYNNFEVSLLRDQLVQIVSQFIPSSSASYNSLQSIGLSLDSTSVEANTNDATTSTDADSDSSTYTATDGQLAALDTTTFEAALAADPTAVEQLFTSTAGLADSMGAALTTATGLPTYLQGGIAGDIPTSGTLTNVEDMNQLQIDSLEEQINQINTEAKMQADSLRDQFTASETQIAELQVLQQQISAIGSGTS